MQDDRTRNGGNGNGASHAFDDMTVGELAKLLLEDGANNRREILEEVKKGNAALEKKLTEAFKNELGDTKKGWSKKFDGLRMVVHQNQTTLMKNHEKLEKRVGVLEKR